MGLFIDPAKAKKATPIVLKDMNLHETIDLGRVHILRVWGGWIYWSFEGAKVVAAVFVPQGDIEDYREVVEHKDPIQMTEEERAEAEKQARILTDKAARGEL